MGTTISRIITKYVSDDWPFTFTFDDASTGALLDMSATTFSANLITESPYTTTAISGGNGSVDSSAAASGVVTVTVTDTLTATLTPDMDSVDVPNNGSTSFNTRLVLIGTLASITTTYCVVPIRVVRR
jgi:hypothetical protein